MAKSRAVPYIGKHGSYDLARNSAQRELEEAKIRLEALRRDQELLEQRVRMLEQTVNALGPLCEDEAGNASIGLTQMCRMVFAEENGTIEVLTVPEVRKRIEGMGGNLHGYKNALAVLHTTLNRLVGGGELNTDKNKQKQTVYWRKR